MPLDITLTTVLFYLFPHIPVFDAVFLFFSFVGSSGLVWIVISGVLILYEELEHRDFLPVFVGGLLFTLLMVNFVIKPIFRRERPLYTLWKNNKMVADIWRGNSVHKPSDFSFPSTHAAISFFAAVTLARYHRKRRVAFYLLAGIITYSRVYLGVHYAFDIVVGAFLGMVVSRLSVFMLGQQTAPLYAAIRPHVKKRKRKKRHTT